MSAQNEQCMADLYDPGVTGSMSDTNNDIFWKLLGSFLVFYMQAGFAMLEAGQVRVKNRNVTLMKNVVDATTGGLVWYLVGYAFASGTSAGGFIGTSWDVLSGCGDYSDWLWKWTFAATAATIVSGAVAERIRFLAYICLSVLMQGFVYPVVAHWVWSDNGWLGANTIGGNGLMDFAGSGVVHVTGGMAAFIGAYIIGPRAGRFSFEGQAMPFKHNDIALTCLGTFCLWFSWFGFNCVSTGSYQMMYVASRVGVVTALGGCAGGMGSLIIGQCLNRAPDIIQALNGILGGLVSITAGANVMEPGFAILTGLIGGVVVFSLSCALKALQVDDAVDATPIHLGGGIWGLLAVGLFASPNYVGGAKYYGVVYGGSPVQLGIQLVGIGSIMAWSGVILGTAFFFLRSVNLLRVSFDEEVVGLDKLMIGSSGDMADSQQAFPPSMPGSTNPRPSYHGNRDTPRATDSSNGALGQVLSGGLQMYLTYSQEHKQNRKPRPQLGEGMHKVSFEMPQTDDASKPESPLKECGWRPHSPGGKAPASDSKGRHFRSEDNASSSSDVSIDIK